MENKTESLSKKVEYNLTFAEYLEAQRTYIKTSPLTYYPYWVFGVLGITVGIIGIIVVPGLAASYGAILLGAYCVLSVTLFHRLRVARLWKEEPNINKPLLSTSPKTLFMWSARMRTVELSGLRLTALLKRKIYF